MRCTLESDQTAELVIAYGAETLDPDATAAFVYARIMGTQAHEPLGYAPAALDLWAKRARRWAGGGVPEDLESAAPQKGKQVDRDVYLYVISGHKVANPAAAQALLERIK